MKTLYFLLFFLSATAPLHARWRPLNMKEIVEMSETIVVAEMIEAKADVSTEKIKVKGQRETQTVRFKVLQSLKGSAGKEILVQGQRSSLCIAQYYFENQPGQKYLLFLRKGTGQIKRVLNGQYGALKINDKNELHWYIKDEKNLWKRGPAPLADVLSHIQRLLS